jgi:hypothetical protein
MQLNSCNGLVSWAEGSPATGLSADRIRVVTDGPGFIGDATPDAFHRFDYSEGVPVPKLKMNPAAPGQATISWEPAIRGVCVTAKLEFVERYPDQFPECFNEPHRYARQPDQPVFSAFQTLKVAGRPREVRPGDLIGRSRPTIPNMPGSASFPGFRLKRSG